MLQKAVLQFPHDPELRKAQARLVEKRHEQTAHEAINRVLADSSQLFGRQWIPADKDHFWIVKLEWDRSHYAQRQSVAEARAALNHGYDAIKRGDGADEILSRAIRRRESAELRYARVMADLRRATDINPGKFGPLHDELVQAERERRPSIWMRETGDSLLANSR